MFILGMVVSGIGSIPKYTLGIPYIDENVKAKAAPMYFGIFVAFGIVGMREQLFCSLFELLEISIIYFLGITDLILSQDKRRF